MNAYLIWNQNNVSIVNLILRVIMITGKSRACDLEAPLHICYGPNTQAFSSLSSSSVVIQLHQVSLNRDGKRRVLS